MRSRTRIVPFMNVNLCSSTCSYCLRAVAALVRAWCADCAGWWAVCGCAEERKRLQAELVAQKNEETRRRILAMVNGAGGEGGGAGPSGGGRAGGGEVVAYRGVDDIPGSRELMIQVDQRNEAVLLPIYGLMVPFHVATIKNVTSSQVSTARPPHCQRAAARNRSGVASLGRAGRRKLQTATWMPRYQRLVGAALTVFVSRNVTISDAAFAWCRTAASA
jgi:hypothetical protein